LGITYGKRISRPNYSALNPFKFYFSDYSFFEGNPNLQPTIHHKFDIQYTLMQKFNFSLFYNHAVNEMVEVNFQDNVENTLRFTNINAPKNDTYGLSFNTSFQITPDWNTTLSADYYYDADQFYAPDETLQKNKVWQYYVYANTNYQWLKDKSLTTELSFYAVSAGVQGPMNISATQDLSLGIQKKMLHDNLTLSLRWNDILNTQITTIATSYLDQQNYFIDNRETQSFQLGLRYRFGNQKLKQKSNKNQNAEQQRL
jgi:hypothetical protein